MKKSLLILLSLVSSLYGYSQGGKVGINTTTPAAMLHVMDSSVVFTGPNSIPAMGSPPVSGMGTRFMWYPQKAALRAGNVTATNWDRDSIGLYSVAFGYNPKARGFNSTAIGANTVASGEYSMAMGHGANASGNSSIAMRGNASGNNSIAMGGSIASGNYSTAMGVGSIASGIVSTVMGFNNIASGRYSIAMGSSTESTDTLSTTMGWNTTASANYSTAMGEETMASGIASTAMGDSTMASGIASTAMGAVTIASGIASTAMGAVTIASGIASTAMGDSTIASGPVSTAMGNSTIGSGPASTAMGNNTIASGSVSTAMGNYSKASGDVSNSFGDHTKARAYGSFVIGRYNDTTAISSTAWNNSDPLFIIGNGTSVDALANAMTVLKNGNVGIGPDVTPDHRLHIVSNDSGDGGWIEGIMVENTNANTGEAAVSFRNKAVPANKQWIVGLNQTPPSLSFNYGNTFAAVNTKVSLDTLGKLGIGTTSPDAHLHISKGTGGGEYNTFSALIIEDDADQFIQFSNLNNNQCGIRSGNSDLDTRSAILFFADSSITFRAGGNTTRMTIENNGNVGIGTTNPLHKLHLTNNFPGDGGWKEGIMVENLNATAGEAAISFRNSAIPSNKQWIVGVNQSSPGLSFNYGSNLSVATTRMFIDTLGNVGIGLITPGYLLEVDGTAGKPGGGSWSNSSDIRLKQNIHPYTDGLESILKINPVTYQYNELSGYATDPEYIGVIAQELKEIAPYMVSASNKKTEDGVHDYLSVDNSAMTYMLINAVKQQQKIINEIKETIENQSEKMNVLTEELNLLKQQFLQRMQKIETGNQ